MHVFLFDGAFFVVVFNAVINTSSYPYGPFFFLVLKQINFTPFSELIS